MGRERGILAEAWKWLEKRVIGWAMRQAKAVLTLYALLPVEGRSSFWRVVADAG
jgi:hypothetical protein